MSATRKKDETSAAELELLYRFPHSSINLEIVPTAVSFGVRSFGVRLNWHRGKTFFAFVETSPLRPVAEATLDGQSYPIFLTHHEKRGMGRVALWGERDGAKVTALVEGREDRLTWTWTIEGEARVEGFTLHLPLAAGGGATLWAPDSDRALALLRNGVGATVAPLGPGTLIEASRGVALHSEGQRRLVWEQHFAPARTESEVRDRLVSHLAELGDRRQESLQVEASPLGPLMQAALARLSDPARLEKPSMDRLRYRDGGAVRVLGGEGADTARAAGALLAHYYLSGDDALRRQARLLAQGLCDFQVSEVESPHWGAFWDALNLADLTPSDRSGGQSVGIVATARASRGLHLLNSHFDTEQMLRAALASAQWLLLKTDVTGLPIAERFDVSGPPLPDGSLWAAGETMTALVETFRVNGNETYLKAALRSVGSLRSRTADGSLRPENAPTEWLAACIEGVLLISREYENGELVAFARRLGETLRARRQPDGWIDELPGREPATPLAATLAAARAALALARVDDDATWPLLALRALRAAAQRFEGRLDELPIADQAGLASLPLGILLALGARPRGGEADRERVCIKRGWQIFEGDPATREYIRVTTEGGGEVDYLALVCQASFQVQIVVLAPPSVTEVSITKNQRTPYVRNLLSGTYEQRFPLEPLGDGREARYGVFIADT